MKKQIEETLHCLIGHPFWGAGRIANLLTFQFGPHQVRTNRRGKPYEVGTYVLHVQCVWHLADAQRILAASGDLSYRLSKIDEEMSNADGGIYAWSKTESSLLDERLFHFFHQHENMPFPVQAVRADEYGGLIIALSENHRLAVFPDTSLAEECWRFFQLGTDLPHLVVTGQGLEDQGA